MSTDRFTKALHLSVQGLRNSIQQHMPDCAYRDFCLWILSAEEPVRMRWLDTMGVPQLVRLTLSLLDGLLQEHHWEPLMDAMLPINTYLTYEVISDNLALGLARPGPADKTPALRREVLLAFNSAMVERLRGGGVPARELLEPQRSATERISAFEQSLSPAKHRSLAQLYLAQHRHVLPTALEHAVWPGLLANIETCVDMARAMEGHAIHPLLVRGLINRYQGCNALLEDAGMAFPRRVHIGVDTILVEPTLFYYAGVLGERLYALEHFRQVVEDGTLAEAAYYAARQVRLLNDLGPTLVTQTDEQRKALLQALKNAARAEPSHTLSRLLLDSTARLGPVLTRIQKDLEHGEFNLVLHGLMDMPALQALPLFEQKLAQCAQLYAQGGQRLRSALGALSATLEHDGISQTIGRFVFFHEKLYANQYNEQSGEYAV
jgi:hypothetical protein